MTLSETLLLAANSGTCMSGVKHWNAHVKGRIQASELELLWGGPVTFSNTNILDFAVVTFSCTQIATFF